MKQINLVFNVIFLFLFLFLGTGMTRAEFNYYDDFNSMNTQFWLIFRHGGYGAAGPFTQDYSLGQIQNGLLNLPVNTTDNGPELITKPIRISSNSVISVSWKSKIHYANDYFAGAVYFQLVNYDGLYPNNSDTFAPYKYFDANGDLKWKRLPTVYYRYYYYPYDNHYPEPRGGNSFGICGNGECLTSPPIWDQWFSNKVEINIPEGMVKFWQNDQFIGEVPINSDIDLNETPYLRIWFSPYGWWTGHSMSLDWFSINIRENSDTGNGSEDCNIDDCERCLPKFNMEDYSLYIPNINIGGENYELKFTLKSVLPEIVLKLDRCSESTCEADLTDDCSNYIPSFDVSTNKLRIPFIDLGGIGYFLDFTLKDILPFVTFKLANYGESQICNITEDNNGNSDSDNTTDEIKNLVLNTQEYENNFFSFVSESYDPNNYDISAEPWCTSQPGLCGNYVQVTANSLNEIINVPTSGYLSDESGFENCDYVEVNKVYINKNRDGSYTAFIITNATKITENCDWNLEIQYKKIR